MVDERLQCPYCAWSTQLLNKFERHLEKKHGDELPRGAPSPQVDVQAHPETADEEE